MLPHKIRIWYEPLSLWYTSNVAEGQGNVPTFLPCQEGIILLSIVMVKSASLMLSTLKGSIVGIVSAASPSIRLIVKGCPPTM